MRTSIAALISCLLVAAVAYGAAPAVPSSFSYQGVLLDGSGQPQSGPVDLTIRLWDQGFAGTLLYKQELENTSLVDGVFAVQIGPTGVGTDIPTNPLTASLSDVLTTDLGSSGEVWLEVAVDGSTPLARTRLQSVPFAVKADSATQADTASNVLTPAGVDAVILDSIWRDFNFDGGPPNADPLEGTADTDQDGILNFVDPDNDNDGLSDATEVAQGSGVNLVTPSISSFSRNGSTVLSVPITGTGSFFDPAMTVTVGGAGVSPTNVSPTSFDFIAPPFAEGQVPVVATLPNGEVANASLTYELVIPTIASFSSNGSELFEILITTTGTGFDPSMTVTVGGTAVTPTNVSPTSFDFVAPIMPPGVVQVVVTHPNGQVATRNLTYDAAPITDTDPTEAVAIGTDRLLVHSDAGYYRDTVDDGGLSLGSLQNITFGELHTRSIHWNSGGRLAAVLHNANTDVEYIVDTDLDGTLEASEAVTLTTSGIGTVTAPSLIHDASDRPAIAFLGSTAAQTRVQIRHDRDGNGDFLGTNEDVIGRFLSGATTGTTARGELMADSAGRLAYVFEAPVQGELHVIWDRSGDGDFNDTVGGNPERQAPISTTVTCLGADFDATGAPVVVYGNASGLRLLRDTNADGDFADAGEDVAISSANQGAGVQRGCDVDASGSGLAIATSNGVDLALLVDRNGDGDFADANEDVLLDTGFAVPIAIERLGDGTVVVGNIQGAIEDPN